MKYWLKILSLGILILTTSILVADARRDQTPPSMQADLSAIANMSLLKCPKCQNQMERGFVLDDRGPLANTDALWVQGPVVRHKFRQGEVEAKVTRHIEAFRCTACGYLELYAKQP